MNLVLRSWRQARKNIESFTIGAMEGVGTTKMISILTKGVILTKCSMMMKKSRIVFTAISVVQSPQVVIMYLTKTLDVI